MKKIFITQRLDKIGKHNELRDNLDNRFTFFFNKIKMLPIIIPNNLGSVKILLKKIKPNGIVLSPGGDPLKKDERLIQENFLINYAKTNKIPILGICRGAQIINIFFKGKISKINNHVRKKHKLSGQIIPPKSSIKSYCFHSQGIKIKNLSKKLKILAQTKDGSIECFKHSNYKIMGIMWHPERMRKFRKFDMKIIKDFF